MQLTWSSEKSYGRTLRKSLQICSRINPLAVEILASNLLRGDDSSRMPNFTARIEQWASEQIRSSWVRTFRAATENFQEVHSPAGSATSLFQHIKQKTQFTQQAPLGEATSGNMMQCQVPNGHSESQDLNKWVHVTVYYIIFQARMSCLVVISVHKVSGYSSMRWLTTHSKSNPFTPCLWS